jgi:hypothetical protein
MSTRVTSIVLPRSHFHGFTTNVATKVAVQPDANKDLILIQLNNVDPNLPTDGSLNLTNMKPVEQANLSVMASFATSL